MRRQTAIWLFGVTLVTLIRANFCSRYKEYIDNRHIGIVPHDVHPGYIIQQFQEQNPQHYNVYRLLKSDYSSYFTVLNNGQVMTVAKLNPLVNKQIKLIVIEEIPNGNITHILKLHVLNHSKMLRFSQPTYEGGKILENQPPFTRVSDLPSIYVVGEGLHANPDTFPMLKHRIIEGNEDDSFVMKHVKTEINQNGSYVNYFKILAKKSLDREERNQYVLHIQVTDAKGVDKVSAKVYIDVLDENDNSPVFKLPIYEFYVGNFQRWLHSQNNTFGVKEFPVLGYVSASDADDGDSIVYQLATPTDVIIVVPQTGEVVLTGNPLNMTAGSKMEFVVEAHDLRSPIRVSQQPAQIWLNIFRQPTSEEIYGQYLEKFTNELYYNEPYHFLRRHCITKKWHMTENAVLENHASGRRSKKSVGSEQPDNVFNPEDTIHRIMKRRVTRAVRPTKRIDLSETDGESEGRVVFQVEKEAERETFKMREENPWISVEPSGAVRVKKKWDYEELGPEKVIDFWVVITNPGIGGKNSLESGNITLTKSGHDAHTDNQRIIIALKDVNDEPPYFINRPLPMQAVVQLNAPPNTPVFTLQARDPDTDANIHYFIVRDRSKY